MTTADCWIALPLLILAGSAILVLILGAISPALNGIVVGVTACAAAALWAAQTPPAISAPLLGIAATPLARLFIILFSLSAGASLILSRSYTEQRGIYGEEYPATILFATFGMVALASATNLLTLFLGLEAMTFGFYILVAIDLNNYSSSEAGLKYLLMGAIAAAFLAFGIALHYSGTGSLSISGMVRLSEGNPLAMAGWGFILIGIGFKLSLVPAHLWTPDVYQGAPPPVTALLSAASKGAAILILLQMLGGGDAASQKTPLCWLAALSMLAGNLAALLQQNVKRMLGYSSIAQMGYATVALASGGYSAALYYAVAYATMSIAAFGAITLLESERPLDTAHEYDGIGSSHPFVAGVLATALFSLAGIPPTAGFTGKFLIFTSAVKDGNISLAVIGILTSAVSAYYYLRVVVHLYLNRAPAGGSFSTSAGEAVVLGTAFGAILLLGAWPSPLLNLIAVALR